MVDRFETRKDTIQVAVESAFSHVGHIASIITGAGRDITREIGDWASDVFEMREAARRAQADRAAAEVSVPPGEPQPTLNEPHVEQRRLRRGWRPGRSG